MPTMVSRLPKFCSRPRSSSAASGGLQALPGARLTNGFYHHPGPAPSSGKPVVGPASFSFKWRKEAARTEDGGAESERQWRGGTSDHLGRHAKPGATGGRGPAALAPPTPPGPRTPPAPKPGLPGSRPRSFPRAGAPGSGSGSPAGSGLQEKPAAGRSRSSDSLGLAPPPRLTDSSRSRSLTQVRPQPSPVLAPPSPGGRGLKEPTPSCAQAPPTGAWAKSPDTGRRPWRSGLRGPSPFSTSALKKPLLPSGISYKLSRPSITKQTRPLRPSPGLAALPKPRPDPHEARSQTDVWVGAETLEDMSSSSSSSLERDDANQEYMDDFDNLGNGGGALALLSSNADEDDSGLDRSCARLLEDEAEAPALRFLEDGVEPWARRSSTTPFHEQGGSSLDLSPADSCGSGATYMWDEEGLEPLVTNAEAGSAHRMGSFESDANSIDLLTNLDSGDLEDDDLMLDADSAEDVSLRSDGDGTSRMAEWRRRQLCWGTQDVHNDNESVPLGEGTRAARDAELVLDLCPSRRPPGVDLDVDVDEVAGSCSQVRAQLERLQMLLLQEEDGDAPSPDHTQVQQLLQEVQQLREDLRSRDRTIAQLTLQLSVSTATTSCRCQETTGRMDQHTQTSVTERESVASQTPWREHTPQVLHSSGREDPQPLRGPVSTPPPQAPPPASPRPEIIATEHDGKTSAKGRRGGRGRSLRLPQPSKLRLFLSQGSAPPPKTGPSSPGGAEVEAAPGVRGSRLPRPKSHCSS